MICHGDFLNPARDYEHVNDNVPNFGAYGDIMNGDRKMYVVRTPYAIADGLAGQRTLILPSGWEVPDGFKASGPSSAMRPMRWRSATSSTSR